MPGVTFLLDAYRSEKADFLKHWAAYRDYLESMRARFPPGAFTFATANWHYDATDPRCPHDAWVETLIISEPSSGERSEHRSIAIHLRLLGAYHNGHIEPSYRRVQSYSLETPANAAGLGAPLEGSGHGDWLVDEVRLSDLGLVLHEVLFARGSRWLIECADITYQWRPFRQ
jgi:hypothetical protein